MACACLVAVLVGAEVVTTVRVFQVPPAAVTPAEASSAVLPLLSEDGSLTVYPHQRRLVVQDRPEVVGRVADVMERLSGSPSSYRIVVELLEASNDAASGGEPTEVDARVRRMFHFTSFRSIGRAIFEGAVGEPNSGAVGRDFNLSFRPRSIPAPGTTPWGIRDPGSRVHLERLRLLRTRVGSGGVATQQEVLRTSMVLGPRQRVIVGASASEGSDRALVLILEAEKVGEG
jgi:hypothetical protein